MTGGNLTSPFGYPVITNTQPLSSLATYMNDVTGGAFWYLMMMLLFGVSFVALKYRAGTDKALLGSLFITSVVASLLSIIGLIDPVYIVFFWIITGMIAALNYYNHG